MSDELVLLVDDQVNITDLARMYLEQDGFRIETEVNGLKALNKIRQRKPSLVVLDLMLPGMDGFEICRTLRAEKNFVPVILLTARDSDIDKILGLELGADDYMSKPFNPRELSARVKAILRRTKIDSSYESDDKSIFEMGDIKINDAAHEITISGELVDFRKHEYGLLKLMIQNPNRVFTREQLLNLVWGYEYAGQTRTVDMHIAQVRSKITESKLKIETIMGVGYKLVA